MFRYIFITTLMSVASVTSWASFQVNIDVDGFVGPYYIDGINYGTGDKILSLDEGTHELAIRYGGSFDFDVDSNGDVTSQQPATASGSGDTLTLNNVTVSVDSGSFVSAYSLGASSYLTGSQSLEMPVGVDLQIRNGSGYEMMAFSISSSGVITRTDSKANMTLGSYSIDFDTINVDVKPLKYHGQYAIRGGNAFTGEQSFQLVPETTHRIVARGNIVIFAFNLDEDSLLSTTTLQASSANGYIEIFTNLYEITPPTAITGWELYGIESFYNDEVQKLSLIPGINHRFKIGGAYTTFNAENCEETLEVTTGEGDFTLDCINYPSFDVLELSESEFNYLYIPFELGITDGEFSVNINDFSVTNNGQSVSLADADLSTDTFFLPSLFKEGPNVILFSGKDYLDDDIDIAKTYWAGSAQVTVTTAVESNVELEIEVVDGMSTYDFIVSGDTVDKTITFKNVPQLEATITVTSTERGVEKKTLQIRKETFVNFSQILGSL